MITKFRTIKNLAVFKNFVWDSSVCDGAGTVQLFKEINVIYGRNYSGKTTLSRIVRALETGKISDKYENPEFEVSFSEAAVPDANQANLTSHGKKIRVFNEDFVKKNLRFISNPDESVNPFAILGGNTSLEAEIAALKTELGESAEGNESGFYLELKNAKEIASTTKQAYDSANNTLNQQLRNKAINNPDGIKYKSDRFGDINYNTAKLEQDIEIVIRPSFIPISNTDVAAFDALLKETVNPNITPFPKAGIDIKNLMVKVETLVTKPISNSDKIEQLAKDAVLNRWVKEGRQLHKGKLEQCSFCGNDISSNRWSELDSHFDEESERLELEINGLAKAIQAEMQALDRYLGFNTASFYSKYHKDLDRLAILRDSIIAGVKGELNKLVEQLQLRKNNLLTPCTYSQITDNSKRLEWCWGILETIRLQANAYTSSLGTDQADAKEKLRLREVSDFVDAIQYPTEVAKIEELRDAANTKAQERERVVQKIQNQKKMIDDKMRLMNDEEKGALKVNEYLNNFFGHDFLSLKALEEADQFGGKKIRFEIVRNGKTAHHLSEGECSLIAFCYFMAKLEDIETKGTKPIIWIDDPISSLDSNHIFFVYSLINSEIIAKQEYEQLFVTTHNLDFLKYLKRLPGASNNPQRGYFIVSREYDVSRIKLMPKYLKEYVTEFNYLFHQIFLCANANADDDTQHGLFYNFGNNARKFLEAFLFYKYPNANGNDDKLARFFGDNRQASSMTDRINNEFSHLEGLFERGMVPVDIAEMKKTATFILARIKEKDNDQYESLLMSIGVAPAAT